MAVMTGAVAVGRISVAVGGTGARVAVGWMGNVFVGVTVTLDSKSLLRFGESTVEVWGIPYIRVTSNCVIIEVAKEPFPLG